MSDLLSIQNLTVQYIHDKQPVSAIRNVSLTLQPGESIGLVGESGCGKSTLALSLMGLLPERESRIPSGHIKFKGVDLLNLSKEEMRRIRGKNIGMIFQDPFSSLNPVMTVEEQIWEIFDLEGSSRDPNIILKLLEEVQLQDAPRILSSYPHQLSGGQRQRVLIAMALARRPDILIADEPTTALDVLVQDEIVRLLVKLQKDRGMAMIFVTHNMGLIKNIAHQTAVMYAGQIVEQGKTDQILKNPQHPYTQGLLLSLPKLRPSSGPLPMLEGQPPEPANLPTGCAFHPRCAKVLPRCPSDDPEERLASSRPVRCHLY